MASALRIDTTTLDLFEYGHLRRPNRPSNISVPGDLRVRHGNDAAAIFGDLAASASVAAGGTGLVWGQLVPFVAPHMRALDLMERPQYVRVIVRTSGGILAWAYEYVGSEPFAEMPLCPTGIFPPEKRVE